MTREEAKRRAELYSALAEGKAIQVKDKNLTWVDKNIEELDYIYDCNNYRIKPEPKYRPFKNQEECWQEMLKHQPFGWLKHKRLGYYQKIDCINKNVSINMFTNHSYMDVMELYTFVDCTPFGIKEIEL